MRARRLAAPENKACGFRPLYRQVRDILVKRMADGVWQAGQMLPSEAEIALDLGVSQGTVRKALDSLSADNLLVRRQGRGTFVARHDDERILFQFFKLIPDHGERRLPESRITEAAIVRDAEAARALGLQLDDPIVRLDRVRSFEGEPTIVERIHLPADTFPGIERRDLPGNLYTFFAVEFGITIGRASERLKAIAGTEREALALGAPPGAPLLRIDRLAYALDGRRVEWRVSYCCTGKMHYRSDLR